MREFIIFQESSMERGVGGGGIFGNFNVWIYWGGSRIPILNSIDCLEFTQKFVMYFNKCKTYGHMKKQLRTLEAIVSGPAVTIIYKKKKKGHKKWNNVFVIYWSYILFILIQWKEVLDSSVGCPRSFLCFGRSYIWRGCTFPNLCCIQACSTPTGRICTDIPTTNICPALYWKAVVINISGGGSEIVIFCLIISKSSLIC